MYVLGTYVRDVMKLNLDARNFRIFAPDETASNRLQAVFDVTGRRFLDHQTARYRRKSGSRWPGHGLHALRAFLRGLPGGLSAHGPPRLLRQLRGVHPHRGLHVLPARQMAENVQRAALAAGYRLSELHLWPPTSGSRITTASPIRIPASWTMWPTRRRTWCACICRRMPTACSAASTTASRAGIMSTSWWPASIPVPSGSPWSRPSSTAPRASASGSGPPTTPG